MWSERKNACLTLVAVEKAGRVLPAELIKTSSKSNNSLEDAVLGVMDKNAELQEQLQRHMNKSVELIGKLKKIFLLLLKTTY